MKDYKDMVCLYATGGDCSSRGMGDKNCVLMVPQEHFELVRIYMRAQLEIEMLSYMYEWAGEYISIFQIAYEGKHCKKNGDLLLGARIAHNKYSDAGNALIDAGVFEHKWHKRTDWSVGHIDELLDGCYGDVKTFNVEDILQDRLTIERVDFSEEALRDWFGDRGYPIQSSKITFRVVKNNFGQWVFLRDTAGEPDEVVVYEMGGVHCEPDVGYPKKGFSWSLKNLQEKINDIVEDAA